MELKASDFDELHPYRLKNTKKPTAILFKSSTCPHCIAVMPMWKKVRNRLLFMNVHTFTVDDPSENYAQFNRINDSLKEGQIVGFPTFLFYKPGGEEIQKLEGSDVIFEDVLEKGKEISL